MNEEQIKALGNAEFFKLFMDACKQTYTEYCELQAEKESLTKYSEPMYEFAMTEFETRIGEMLPEDSLLHTITDEDKALLDSLCPNERDRFEKWFALLNQENAKRSNTFYSGQRLEQATGMKSWFDYFTDGYEPYEALDEDVTN